MRLIRYAVLALIALLLVTLATANLGAVTLYLLPADIALLINYPAALNQITLPLFVILLGAVVLGVLLGYVAEWAREHKYRSEAKQKRREAEKLNVEVKKLKSEKAQGDDVLALLDEAGPAR